MRTRPIARYNLIFVATVVFSAAVLVSKFLLEYNTFSQFFEQARSEMAAVDLGS